MWKLLELPFLSFFPENRHKPVFGSIHTMAPERLQGKEPDFRSDFYSLGCLYYYALTGRYPHIGSEAEIAIGHLRFDPAPITETVEISHSLENWIGRMMAKDPAMRFQSAADAKQSLSHVFGQIMPRTWV
jgi:serine/threonine protein kinase